MKYGLVAIGLIMTLSIAANDDFPIYQGPGDQTWPDVCWDGKEFWVVWQNNADSIIYGARVASDGIVLDTTPIPYPHHSHYNSFWPSVAFGDTILSVAFQSLRYDSSRQAPQADVAFVRFRPDGSIVDTAPRAIGGSGSDCDPTDASQLTFGTNHLVCFVTGTVFPMQFEEFRSVGVQASDGNTIKNLWSYLDAPGWESGITGILDGDRILTVFTAGNAWSYIRQKDTVFGLFLQDTLQLQNPKLFKIRTEDDFPSGTFDNWFSAQDKKIAHADSVYLLVSETGTGPIWFDILGKDGLPVKPSPTMVNLFGAHPRVIWNGENFFVTWQHLNDIAGMMVNQAGNIKNLGYYTRQSYDEREPSLAFGGGKTLLVWRDNRTGDFDIYGMFIDSASIGVGEKLEPSRYETPALSAFPNPFSHATDIQFQLPQQTKVTLKIYDATGRFCRTLADGQQPAGIHVLRWDGRDETGAELPEGIFFVELKTNEEKLTTKLIKLNN